MDRLPSSDRVALHIGTRVRARRLELGLSEDAVATATGVTGEDLLDSEAGRVNFTAADIYELSRVLRVLPSWFFEGLL